MGLPIKDLVIATNVNDILHRTLQTGRYEVLGVEPTQSPSMDIQVSSNFERLLFEAAGKDAEEVGPADGEPQAVRRVHLE
jgi:threonine synthase